MSCRKLCLIFAATQLTSATLFAQAVEPAKGVVMSRVEELNLSVGENRTLPASDVKSYSEGVRGVAEIKLTPDNNQFVIVGQKPGSTTLLLLKKDGTEVSYAINVF